MAVPTIRAQQPAPEQDLEAAGVEVDVRDDRPDVNHLNEAGRVARIEHPDGSITVSMDGSPLDDEPEADLDPEKWFGNLAEKIGQPELQRIAQELLTGISDDDESRKDWIESRATGMSLLGLKVDTPSSGSNSAADGEGVAGMSKVKHPLLLESVLKFQANARGEFLPTDGPVKIRDDDLNPAQGHDELADALAKDMNHYLTVTATEYYPDTDRMLMMAGFGGLGIKKIYFCPLRNRPVSESIDADDFIIDNNATDIMNARRVTHRMKMKPSTMKRMQILKAYRNIPLGTPAPTQPDAVQAEKKEISGQTSTTTTRAEDRDHEIYECYCELNIAGFEHKIRGADTGLEMPYRVTIEKTSREILSICRNYYPPEDGQLPEARQVFVAYVFVPGFGFYPIGLLNILGNTTTAVTAAWRILLDSGMFSNFPGFLYADQGMRQNTNVFRVPAGGGAPIKTGGLDIQKAVMPLPYNTQNAPALMSLVQDMVTTGSRLGGTAEIQVGEGKQDAPVGTTVALLEQAAKIMSSVHKRFHTAQALEFQLLKREFKEHPESLGRCDRRKLPAWNQEVLRRALDDCNLVPQADPNTSSHIERMAKTAALAQRADAKPQLYDPVAVEKKVLTSMGFTNPEQYLAPPAAMAKPPPELEAAQAEAQVRKQEADAKTLDSQTRAQEAQSKHGLGMAELHLKEQAEQQRSGLASATMRVEAQTKHAELQSRQDTDLAKERTNLIDVAQNLAVHPLSAPLIGQLVRPAFEDVQRRTAEQARRGSGLASFGSD